MACESIGSINLIVEAEVEVELRQRLAGIQPLERVHAGFLRPGELLERVRRGRRSAEFVEGSDWTVL